MTLPNTNHFIRQIDLINPERLVYNIGIIGAGAIGGWTALALLKMGCQDITVYDPDSVEEHNCGSQLFTDMDIGKPKVEALKDKLELMTDGSIEAVEKEINLESLEALKPHNLIIFAVDNIEARKEIFEALAAVRWSGILIDGRMAGDVLEVYTIPTGDSKRVEHYKSTLFDGGNGQNINCSARSVVYNVFVVGGLIADVVAKLATEQNTPQEMIFDLKNFMLTANL